MEHTFSIELTSKRYVRHFALSDTSPERVFFEGSLGQLRSLRLIECSTLEISGVNGVLRVDLCKSEIDRMLLQQQENKQ
jgi:hypothetical protein